MINLSLVGSGTCSATEQNAINGACPWRGRGDRRRQQRRRRVDVQPGNCAGVIDVAATDKTGARAS